MTSRMLLDTYSAKFYLKLRLQTTSRVSYHFLSLTEFPASLCVNHISVFSCVRSATLMAAQNRIFLAHFIWFHTLLKFLISVVKGRIFAAPFPVYSSAVQFSPLLISGNILTFQFRSHNVISLTPFTFLSYYAKYEKYICAWGRLLTSILPFLGPFFSISCRKGTHNRYFCFVLGQLK